VSPEDPSPVSQPEALAVPGPSRLAGGWRRLQSWRGRARGAALFAAGIGAALVAVLLYGAIFPAPRPLSLRDVNDAVGQAMASATPPPSFSAQVYQVVQPSLVLIEAQATDKSGKPEDRLGSGVIIDDRGDILTSLHVVAGSADILLVFADGTHSPARILKSQPENDIAVLAALQPPAQIVPAVLGNPRAMHIGDEAYVVGNHFGLYSSMSAGVISGFNRSFQPQGSAQALHGLIQIDAAVNPGNSGGPLLNRDGQVIGIVAGIVNPTDQDVFIGIGFAVPINTAAAGAGLPPY
jgi:S1-C subfamily serine protease